MNNFTPFGSGQNQNFQNFQQNQFFIQPQGNLYMINNSNEINSVPVGLGVSAAICLSEGIIYLKTIQNGAPMIIGYKLNSLDENTNSKVSMDANTNQNSNSLETKITSILNGFENRLKALEDKNIDKTKGGKPEWQL